MQRNVVAVLGAALFLAGFVLFFAFDGRSGGMWSWSVGPLLWLIGGVLVVGWSLHRTFTPRPTLRLVPKRRDDTLHRAA